MMEKKVMEDRSEAHLLMEEVHWINRRIGGWEMLPSRWYECERGFGPTKHGISY